MYVGKTKRQLRIRIGEHITSIKKKDDERPLAMNFNQCHQGDPKRLMVRSISVLNLPTRRGDFDTILLQKDLYTLGSLVPHGLNNECNLQTFLEVLLA